MKNSSVILSVCFLCLLQISVVLLDSSADVRSLRKAVVEHEGSSTVKPDESKASQNTDKGTPKPSISATDNCTNGSNCNEEPDGYIAHFLDQVSQNKDMLLRTMYVLIGVTGIVIVYFVVRAWRLRSRRRKARKYGIITTPASDLEMAPLGQGDDDDDDEDMTVFEAHGRRLK